MTKPIWATWLANIKGPAGPTGPQGPPIPQSQVDASIAAQLPAAVDSGIQSTGAGRLSGTGAAVSEGATFTDLNALNASGWYRALSTALNRPATGTFSVLHWEYTATNAAQIAISVSTGATSGMYFRAKRSSVWDAWTKVTGPDDLPPAVESGIQSTGSGRISDLGTPVSDGATFTDLNTLTASGWYRAFSSALNRPASGVFSVLHWEYGDANSAQLAISVATGSSAGMYFRAERSSIWDPWVKVTTQVDLDARVAGLVNELDLVADYTVGVGQTWTDLNLFDPPQSAVVRALPDALNRPPVEQAFMVSHMRGTALSVTQVAVELGAQRSVWVRMRNAGGWSAWLRLVDGEALDSRVAGLVNELALTTDAELNTRVAGLVAELGLTTDVELDARVAGLIPELDLASSAVVSSGGRWADLNAVDAAQPVLLEVFSDALNRPVSGFRLTGWHIPSDTSASQLLVSSSNPPHMWTRAITGGVWSDWQQIVDGSILDTRIAALANELDLMVAVPEDQPTRSSKTVVPVTFRDKTRRVYYRKVYSRVYPGVTWTGIARRRADVPVLRADGTLHPDVIPTIAPGVLTGLKVSAVEGGPLVLEVRADGKTYVQGVAIDTRDTGQTVKRVVVVPTLGQSNLVAHGQPIVPLLDGASDRIWQLPDGGSTLIPAAVPLTGPGDTATGLSPAHALARQIAQHDPECVVVLVPAAKGGSGLVTDPAMGYGKWAIDYAGPNPHLYANAVAKMTQAIAQAAARWPGITPSVVTTWIQGEADGADGITRAAYAAALDVLIADWVGRFGGIFLLAGLVPQAATSGTRPQIVLALQDTPRRVEHTAFVRGVDNGGGARGTSDVIHYGREAAEIIGRAWFEAIPRASNNVTGSYTTPPVTVTASRWGDDVTVDWSYPYSRVTAFEVQSSPDGSTWTDETVTEPVATRLAITSAVPVKVRIRAVGTGTSNWTAPVAALSS